MPAKLARMWDTMWSFRKLGPGEPERKPREAEFFNVGDNDVAAALVREAVQNSLDARLSALGPVRVRFTFSKQKKAENGYYAGLIEHVKSCNLLPDDYAAAGDVGLLVVEDFGTTGLDGPVTLSEAKDAKSNYCDFWWREGKSQKTGGKAGRWGLGKTAFHVASGLRSLWGYTVRSDDSRRLLLGKAVLDTHVHKGERYDYYGYYASEDFRPVEDVSTLQEFLKRFGVTREGESGLSIVIPLPVTAISAEAVVRWSIINYFFPIIRQMLVIEVSSDGKDTILKADTLREAAKKQDWKETPWEERNVESLMEFLEDAATTPEEKTFVLNMPYGTPRWTKTLLGEKLTACRDLFDAGQLLSLRAPVTIRRKGEPEASSHFELYLKRDVTLARADEFYFRAGITISEIKKLGSRKVRGLLSAHEDGVSAFLGDCESPAHTDWKERAEGFQERYHGARDTLRFIKASLAEVVKMLDQPMPGVDKAFLEDLFYISRDREDTKKESPKPVPPLTPPKKQIFSVDAVTGGFRVHLSDKTVKLPTYVDIRVAYDVRRGNPFARYNPMDFELDKTPITTRVIGGENEGLSKNTLRASVQEKDFEVQVIGFDVHRDLKVDVREVSIET